MSSTNFPFDTFPRLETLRLVLRQMTADDADDVYRIFSDAHVVEFYDVECFTSHKQAVAMIQRQADRFRQQQGIRWGIAHKTTDTIIGTCGVYPQSAYRGELGYDLVRAQWQQGYMTEALAAVLRFAFDALELHRIQAHVMRGNQASERLLAKLGFVEEGVLRDYGFFKGNFHDLKSFAILQQDYIMGREDGL